MPWKWTSEHPRDACTSHQCVMGPALPCLPFRRPTEDQRGSTHPVKSFQDEEHEVKTKDLKDNMVLSDFREFGDIF